MNTVVYNDNGDVPESQDLINRTQKDEVLKLLMLWGLPELKTKFIEHDVTVRSLQCLTSEDISELIPKIGPRAIFRARLLEWHKQIACNPSTFDFSRTSSSYSYSMPSSIVKVESGFEDDDVEPIENSSNQETNNLQITRHSTLPSEMVSIDDSHADQAYSLRVNKNVMPDLTEQQTVSSITSLEDKLHILKPPLSINGSISLDVRSVLSNNFEGRQAIQYYETNGKLDYSNRKKIVSVIINLALERKANLGVGEFKRMAEEIIQLFPNESLFTYYIPREGAQNPRGALYNKFLNMSRKLRQEGLLQYRKNMPVLYPSYTIKRKRRHF